MGDNKSSKSPRIISNNSNKGNDLSEKSADEPPEGTTNYKDVSFLCFRFRVNKDTLPLKVTLFLYYGAMAAILPYLTIHMLAIGISISETAIIYGVLPFTSFVGPPLIGFLADKLGQYKAVLIIATFSNAFFHSMLLAVPHYREVDLEASVHLQWNPTSNFALLKPEFHDHCEAFMNYFEDAKPANLSTQILRCFEEDFQAMPSDSSPLFDTLIDNSNESHIGHYIAGEFCRLDKSTNGLLQFICSESDLGSDADLDKVDEGLNMDVTFFPEKLRNCSITVTSPFAHKLNASMITCRTDLAIDTGITRIIGNNTITFWMYFLVRIVATIFMSSCFSLLDATTLAIVKKNTNSEYGAERIWTVLGTAAISPIAGLLVDWFSQDKPETDYSAAFYVSNVLFFLNVLSYFVIKLEVDKPEKNFATDAKQLFLYPEVVVFLVMIFILGNMWGFVESYLFVFLKDELDAPNYLLGLTLTTGSLTGVPFLWGAEKIVAKIGRVNVIVIAFVTYFVRFIGYSYVLSPWWCFPFEALEAFTYHLMWAAAATYCSILAPKGLLATLMGVMGALHYSLGKGCGSFIGGYIIKIVQVRQAFWNFGIASGIFGVIYFIMNLTWLRNLVKRRNIKLAVGQLSSDVSEIEKGTATLRAVDANANKNRNVGNNDGDHEVTDAMLPPPHNQSSKLDSSSHL
ncbi:unnamed protein product [Allacma fusca]|uniref:Major facilitator superfamily associated domain-containing protein n=1 Tax=Allacma fusca TaxID=39272 RepID=A0A8J2K1R8_9HEXA|nr:unnamed protein product [Allacma fusca]